jgi:hypothetical protein
VTDTSGPDPLGVVAAGTANRHPATARVRTHMFFFFSNRLGCLGSLLVSAAITVVLIVLLTNR